MPERRDSLWRYAPIWAVLFGAAASLTKSLGTQYILRRKWIFKWSDVATALAGATLGYITFRLRFGQKKEKHWYTR